MAEQLKDLSARFKKIGGLQSLDSGKKKAGYGSRSILRDAGSTGLGNEVPTNILNAAHTEVMETEEEQLSRKRKSSLETEVVANEGDVSGA